MLLEIAVGDAYGAGFEFSSREKIRAHNDLRQFVMHDLGIPAGHYTDDTQMSIAVAEVLLEDGEWTSQTFADTFVRCYKRDPRPGYAKGLEGLLNECGDGATLLRTIRPQSRRNGAAMRSVPIGLLPDIDQVKLVSRAHATITHDTDEGILSAHVVALMAHVLLYKRAKIDELGTWIERLTGFVLTNDWQQEVECDAIQTIHAVHTVLVRHRRMSEVLVHAVELGGDTDSVAAIAMGLAAISPEYTRDVPAHLLETLESGSFGRQFLEALDARLRDRFPALRFGSQ